MFQRGRFKWRLRESVFKKKIKIIESILAKCIIEMNMDVSTKFVKLVTINSVVLILVLLFSFQNFFLLLGRKQES